MSHRMSHRVIPAKRSAERESNPALLGRSPYPPIMAPAWAKPDGAGPPGSWPCRARPWIWAPMKRGRRRITG